MINSKVHIPDHLLLYGLMDADGSEIPLKFLLEDVLGDEVIEEATYLFNEIEESDDEVLKSLHITTPTRTIALVRMAHMDYFAEAPRVR